MAAQNATIGAPAVTAIWYRMWGLTFSYSRPAGLKNSESATEDCSLFRHQSENRVG